jgi:hypothetical protein
LGNNEEKDGKGEGPVEKKEKERKMKINEL